jgi:hypothetical protein
VDKAVFSQLVETDTKERAITDILREEFLSEF